MLLYLEGKRDHDDDDAGENNLSYETVNSQFDCKFERGIDRVGIQR